MVLLSLFIPLSLLFLASCGKEYTVKPQPNPHAKKYVSPQSRCDYRKKRKEIYKKTGQRMPRPATPPAKPLKSMTCDELKEAKARCVVEGNKQMALKYLERILTVETDLKELEQLRLEAADFNFDVGNLEKAEQLYAEYGNFYPGSAALEYAEYKAILCCFYQNLSADRDQTKTKQTIELANSFLNKKHYNLYVPDVTTIQAQCHTTLFESEVHVINFYLSRQKLQAAERRLAKLKEQSATFSNRLIPLLNLECALAQHQGNHELVQQKQTELAKAQASMQPLMAKNVQKKGYSRLF